GLEDADPLLRPGPVPGSYASSLSFRLARPGQDPRDVAAVLAGRLVREPWIATAAVTGPAFLPVAVTHDTLAGLAMRIARPGPAKPAYALRYAHAAAAAVLRWAAALGTRPAGFRPRLLAEPGELALLDALSWLPERVAVAARRGRPDEFAGYLEELAARTIDTMSTTSFTKIPDITSERLWLADAARTGLAGGLGLLGV